MTRKNMVARGILRFIRWPQIFMEFLRYWRTFSDLNHWVLFWNRKEKKLYALTQYGTVSWGREYAMQNAYSYITIKSRREILEKPKPSELCFLSLLLLLLLFGCNPCVILQILVVLLTPPYLQFYELTLQKKICWKYRKRYKFVEGERNIKIQSFY